MLERFLMSLEIIFLVKKQTELEKKLYIYEAIYNFLKEKDSLTNEEKKALKIGILRILVCILRI